MNNAHTTPATCDPRPYLHHQALAFAWCRYNGQKATERQVVRIMNRLPAETLERMLAARGVKID